MDGSIPTREAQKEIIKELAKQPTVKGGTWYRVRREWYNNWMRFVDGEHGASNPGPINTVDILRDDQLILEETEFKLLPHEIWKKMVSWYGRSPIPRAAEASAVPMHSVGVHSNLNNACFQNSKQQTIHDPPLPPPRKDSTSLAAQGMTIRAGKRPNITEETASAFEMTTSNANKRMKIDEEKVSEAEERIKVAEERAKVAEERARVAEERARVAEEKASEAQVRAKSAEERAIVAEEKAKVAEKRVRPK